MPRKPLNIAQPIEYLSILDEKGQLDDALEPAIPEEVLLRLHRAMLLGRRFDERLLSLQRQGRVGTFAPVTGQEAAQLGAVSVLRPSDWMAPSFRETAAELWRGRTMESVILSYGGYNEGGRADEASRTLPVSIPVGSQVLHAMGIAWAIKYRREEDVAMAFLGDGGTSEGDFHEGMNFAAVFQVPAVFVCQNNQWAISIPRSRQTRAETLAQKALAYGMPGIQVDGNDILAVYAAALEAVDRARKGGGPTLIECVTYRMMMHTTADDPKRYRTEGEVEGWRRKDPIVRFQAYLKKKNLLTDEAVSALDEEVKAEIQEAVQRAEGMMNELVDPLVMFDHAYEEMPPSLAAQKEDLRRELEERKGEEAHG